ncbi:MAG: hypothetical protein KDB00_17520 [Planctomycetales bacterium]|nr:hypothetical protein [Planctomycetales bacterium]
MKATRDQALCGLKEIPEESLIVNPDNNGIKDVVVWVKEGRGTKLPKDKGGPKTIVLANDACRFQPHVVLAMTGDTIKVTNPDKVTHNAKFNGFKLNINPSIPPGAEIDVKVEDEEPSVIGVECNIHPWMQARVLLVGHRFSAASDADGVLEITGLPVGEELEFQANHQTGTFANEIMIDGKKSSWKRNRFKVEIKAGVNDLGTIEVPAGEFSK